jgi:hypothetical protein
LGNSSVSGRSRVPNPAAKISALVMALSMPESSPGPPLAWYPEDEMSYFRALSATLLSAAATFSLVTASSCGTSAVGVDTCRDIEQARCRANAFCLDAEGAPLIDDVPACERYYRDHCLHGLAVKPPAGASVSACVQVIEAAGKCAAGDPEATLDDCPITDRRGGLTRACDVVAHPERATECTFLLDTAPDEVDGTAGQSAGGQTSAGSTDTSSGASSGESGGETAQAGATDE